MTDLLSRRASGILLHPTSLPGRSWCGDLGPAARRFIDFLQAAGQSYWQVLPLGPPGYRDTPYQALSSFAGNDHLIALEPLVEAGLLAADDPALSGPLAYDPRRAALRRALETLRTRGGLPRDALAAFVDRERGWLDDYALFAAIKETQGGRPWIRWDSSLRKRDPSALAAARESLRESVDFHRFSQWLFRAQWDALRAYGRERGIAVIGDLPIFVALDSADVWANPALFVLGPDSRPAEVAGVPPDYFSADGQLWGNPIYDWEALRSAGFRWWIDRLRAALALADAVRLDHFIGFHRNWAVPTDAKTARKGRWVAVPGRELLTALRSAVGSLPLIAEDLGFLVDEVRALRDDFRLPGMKVLQFAFSGGPGVENDHLPHTFPRRCVVYTGTHDNDTVVGWWKRRPKSRRGDARARESEEIRREREYAKAYLATKGREIHWDLIHCAYGSVADTAIVPLQDVLGLGPKARMNRPGIEKGNWQWRCQEADWSERTAERLHALAETFGRIPAR